MPIVQENQSQQRPLIYLDNAATTKISDSVFEAMLPFLKERYGNASSIYKLGRDSAVWLRDARIETARLLGAEPREIFFTSGGSESDNWAIKSAARLAAAKGKKHIVSTVFEHHAVLHSLDALKKEGFEITLLPVYENGVVSLEDVRKAIKDDTALVTIMFVNNEIGTIQPIEAIGEICREKGVWFHTDAVQAFGNVPVDVKAQHIDMLSLSGHKIHAQKGTGVLYVNKNIRLTPYIDGGAQESGRRAGTENLAGIAGLAAGLRDAIANMPEKNARLLPLRDKIIERVSKIEHTRLNGDLNRRVVSNLNFSFEGVEGEALLLQLDLAGIAASSGSACTSGSLDPSHVLLSLGLSHEAAHGSLRLTMSESTTEADIDYLLEVLPPIVDKLRGMSPLWERIKKTEQI